MDYEEDQSQEVYMSDEENSNKKESENPTLESFAFDKSKRITRHSVQSLKQELVKKAEQKQAKKGNDDKTKNPKKLVKKSDSMEVEVAKESSTMQKNDKPKENKRSSRSTQKTSTTAKGKKKQNDMVDENEEQGSDYENEEVLEDQESNDGEVADNSYEKDSAGNKKKQKGKEAAKKEGKGKQQNQNERKKQKRNINEKLLAEYSQIIFDALKDINENKITVISLRKACNNLQLTSISDEQIIEMINVMNENLFKEEIDESLLINILDKENLAEIIKESNFKFN